VLGDPLERVYRALDAELGRIIEAAGPDTLIVLMGSHGMGPNYSGDHLLRPMVSSVLRGRAGESGAYGGLSARWNLLPDRLRGGLKPLRKLKVVELAPNGTALAQFTDRGYADKHRAEDTPDRVHRPCLGLGPGFAPGASGVSS
jgi:hypothetical protein